MLKIIINSIFHYHKSKKMLHYSASLKAHPLTSLYYPYFITIISHRLKLTHNAVSIIAILKL